MIPVIVFAFDPDVAIPMNEVVETFSLVVGYLPVALSHVLAGIMNVWSCCIRLHCKAIYR